MPNINDAFPSNYLKASDLQGHDVTVTIDRVEFEAVGREREMKAVVYFTGKQKGIVLNKTNAKKIIEIAGSALTEEWGGTALRIYPTETEFGGETVDCIRIKPVGRPSNGRAAVASKPVKAESEPVTAITDDEIPF